MRKLAAGVAALSMLASTAMAAVTEGAYAEMRRDLQFISADGETAFQLSGGPPLGSRTPDPDFRSRIEGLCANDVAYWRAVGEHLARNTKPPRSESKRLSAAKFSEMLPTHLATVSQTLPAAGQARFLRTGETLRSRPEDLAFALRQRAEWLAVLNKITVDLDQARIARPGDFNASYALGAWTKLKCNLARNGDKLINQQLEAGYPAEADGADSESAFLLLVGATRDPALAGRALAAARNRQPAVGAPAIAALERWASAG